MYEYHEQLNLYGPHDFGKYVFQGHLFDISPVFTELENKEL